MKKQAQVQKSVDSQPGMLTKDHHHTVHEERQVCYTSHLRPKSLHLGVEVIDQDDKSVILYNPKKVNFIKVSTENK